MAEIIWDAIEGIVGIGIYSVGVLLMFILLFVIAYTFACVWQMVRIIVAIKTNLYADKLEEKAQKDFEDYCKEIDNG